MTQPPIVEDTGLADSAATTAAEPAAPAGTEAAEPEALTGTVIPPMPVDPPKPVPAQAPAGRPLPDHGQAIGGSRLPAPGTTITLDPNPPEPEPKPEPEPEPEAEAEADDEPEAEAPAPAAPDWWSLRRKNPPAPAGAPAPAAPELVYDGDPEPVQVVKEPAAEENPARRWAKAAYDHATAPVAREARMSLLDRIRATRINRWGPLYNLAALGVGSYFGLTEWTYHSVASTDLAADAWNDAEPITCYVLYGLVLLLDRWTHQRKFLPLAFLGRIPTMSCAVGALLYGGTETITTAF